jgi:hypothetical protein
MSQKTKYSSDEFTEDYHQFASCSVALANHATPEAAAALIKVFFSRRYSPCEKMASERMELFLKVMVSIEANHRKLAKSGYLTQLPAHNCSRVSDNLIRALHRLIIEDGAASPTFDQISETADLFASRN